MVRSLAILFIVFGLSSRAEADTGPWYRGKYGRNRITHLTLTVAFGAGWLVAELGKGSIAGDCRWCDPPGFDRRVRNRLVWDDTERAHGASNITAYVMSPVFSLGMLVLSERGATATRLIDDLLPIVETVAIAQFATQIAKHAFSRRRPYANFGSDVITSTDDDNLSFWSGHSSLGFALTTSAGLVAHWRGYRTEPYIWGVGIALSLSTEYLRIAADRHYLSDVLVGGVVGVSAGLLVPRLMRRDLKIVPVNGGAAVAGRF